MKETRTAGASQPARKWRRRLTDTLSLGDLVCIGHFLTLTKPDMSLKLLSMGLAKEVLEEFLGLSWVNENSMPPHPKVSSRFKHDRRYLRSDAVSYEDQLRWQHRLRWLSECIYNLHGISGFSDLLAKIRFGGETFARLAELECARFFELCGFDVTVPAADASSSNDVDLRAHRVGTEPINVQVKAKHESTTPTDATIRATLKKAAKQLPSGAPGAIFVRLPEAWQSSIALQDVVLPCVERNHSRYSRVVATILCWEESHFETQATFLLRHWVVTNPSSKEDWPRAHSAIEELSGGGDDRIGFSNWIHLESVARQVLALTGADPEV